MDRYIKKVTCLKCEIPIGEEWERESGEIYIMRYVNFAPLANDEICTRCQNDEMIRKQQQGYYRKIESDIHKIK